MINTDQVREVAAHHRTALKVLCDAGAASGDLFVDAQGHRWRVVYTRIGRCLEGVGFDCVLPPLLMPSIILVGLRPVADEAADYRTDELEEVSEP